MIERTITVEARDVIGARRGDADRCPVARAVQRQVPEAKEVIADLTSVVAEFDMNAHVLVLCDLHPEIKDRISEYDSWGVMSTPWSFEVRLPLDEPEVLALPPRRCRACGCHDQDCSGCFERTGEPCSWVEGDLCSACVLVLEPGLIYEPMIISAKDLEFQVLEGQLRAELFAHAW